MYVFASYALSIDYHFPVPLWELKGREFLGRFFFIVCVCRNPEVLRELTTTKLDRLVFVQLVGGAWIKANNVVVL